MSDQRDEGMEDGDGMSSVGNDSVDGPHVGFRNVDPESSGVGQQVEVHQRPRANDPAHVDLQQEDYTPEEVARLMGTSLEVVMHAVRSGELKAEREGQAVVCIAHADVVDWMRRRGPGV